MPELKSSELQSSSDRRDSTPADVAWRRSQRCGNSGCVEIARIADGIGLRDSAAPDGPVLVVPPDDFRAFVDGVKAGQFDDLCT